MSDDSFADRAAVRRLAKREISPLDLTRLPRKRRACEGRQCATDALLDRVVTMPVLDARRALRPKAAGWLGRRRLIGI